MHSTLEAGNKFSKRAVVRAFAGRREEAAGKFIIPPVIRNTFATFSLAGARIVRAGALLQIFLHSTFHFQIPFFCHRDHSAAEPQLKNISHRGHRDHRAITKIFRTKNNLGHG